MSCFYSNMKIKKHNIVSIFNKNHIIYLKLKLYEIIMIKFISILNTKNNIQTLYVY